MFRKLFWTVVVVGGVVAFVGTDVVGSTIRRARESVRSSLTSAVPLRTQLAEAKAQVDAYAENVIRGEIAAESLKDTIDRTTREVSARRASIERERTALASIKASLEARAANHMASATVDGANAPAPTDAERSAIRRARDFRTATTILERREADLAGLQKDYDATLREVASAKAAQQRLGEEVNVLSAEIEALEARTTVAQTRKACDAVIDRSGYGEAQARLESIRASVREQNKRLEYYAMKADALRDAEASDPFAGESATDAIGAAIGMTAPTATADVK